MATKYADRAVLTINGAEVVDLQSMSMKRNHNSKVVPTMTKDGFNRGFVQGNMDIDLSIQIARQNLINMPKIADINFETNDVAIVVGVGSDSYNLGGIFIKDDEQNASGVGNESLGVFNFSALRFTDGTGASVLFDIALAP